MNFIYGNMKKMKVKIMNKVIGNLVNNGLFDQIFLEDIKNIFEDLKKSLLFDRKMRQNMTKNSNYK